MISDTCTGYRPDTGNPCARPATETITAGCVHEHVGDRSFCSFHADDLRAGQMWCGDCGQGPEPHDCVLVAARERASR